MYTYEELKQFADHCQRCPLAVTRNRPVMGKGNLNAAIMFIAEAPGSSEDRMEFPLPGHPEGYWMSCWTA